MTTLEKAIQDSGLKKKAVSEELGISVSTLKNWSNRKTAPNVIQAVELARILRVNTSEILYFFTHDVDELETK